MHGCIGGWMNAWMDGRVWAAMAINDSDNESDNRRAHGTAGWPRIYAYFSRHFHVRATSTESTTGREYMHTPAVDCKCDCPCEHDNDSITRTRASAERAHRNADLPRVYAYSSRHFHVRATSTESATGREYTHTPAVDSKCDCPCAQIPII